MASTQVKINVPGNHLMTGLLGSRDELLRLVEAAFPDAVIHVRGNEIAIDGPGADEVAAIFEEMVLLVQRGHRLEPSVVTRTIDMVHEHERPSEVLTSEVLRSSRGRSVTPKTSGQKRYVDAIRDNVITFGLGPAGTGKSWLAVAMAVKALQAKEVERIILTRPAVEAGERLGFLPGDLMAKVDPYLRPLYDALYDMVDLEAAQKLLERNTVEVAPLAFMRGRTLNNGFIILDEAQNTTPEQMKMFLTRIGFGSKAVVTGDTTQVDVQGGRSGLDHLEEMLAGIEGLTFVRLSSRDVVRHRIVADIVNAYERRVAPTQVPQLRTAPADEQAARRPIVRPGSPAAGAAPAPARGFGTLEVFVADEQSDQPVDVARWSHLVQQVLAAEGVKGAAELSVLFVSEDVIAGLNKRFMDHDGPTDVLSFPLDEDLVELGRWPDASSTGPDRGPGDPDEAPLLLGDVVICPAVAARNAPDHAGTYDDELALLVVHGVLHVLGMDHADPEEASAMQARERELLDQFHGPLARDPGRSRDPRAAHPGGGTVHRRLHDRRLVAFSSCRCSSPRPRPASTG